jgi:AraC family transcriptional regulator of adaptative response/methylated-DNA-[protein]-cysteine methyltransferase
MSLSPTPHRPRRLAGTEAGIIAVATTNVFCRDGCPAPAPQPGNAARLGTARDALFLGYRPCMRCRPLETTRHGVTSAERQRAERLRPILRSARAARAPRRDDGAIVLSVIETPLGPMLAGVTGGRVCLLEFTDRPMLPTQLGVLERRFGFPLRPGRHPLLDRLQSELDAYFAGDLSALQAPLTAPGTPFQERTWQALGAIPPGTTLSYEELAARAGRPGAQRAAGTANGANRIAIAIPCHRVVRKSGEVGGYGGGTWRKEWLLAHERATTSTLRAGTA